MVQPEPRRCRSSRRRPRCARATVPITASSAASSRAASSRSRHGHRPRTTSVSAGPRPPPLSRRHSAEAPPCPRNAGAASAAAPPQPPAAFAAAHRHGLRGCGRGCAAASSAAAPPPHTQRIYSRNLLGPTTARACPHNLCHSRAHRFPRAAAARVASVSGLAGVDGRVGREQSLLAGRGSEGKRECDASGNAGSEPNVAKSVRAPGQRDRWHHRVQIELRRRPERKDAAARPEELRRGHGR
jgi:hypothetical protein